MTLHEVQIECSSLDKLYAAIGLTIYVSLMIVLSYIVPKTHKHIPHICLLIIVLLLLAMIIGIFNPMILCVIGTSIWAILMYYSL